MTTHEPAHADLLAALQARGGDLTDLLAGTELEHCAGCQEEVARQRAVQAMLDETGAAERRDLEAAREQPAAALEATVQETLTRLVRQSQEPRGGGWRTLPGLLLVGLAATLMLLVARAPREERTPAAAVAPDTLMGSEEPVSPRGPGSTLDRFDWSALGLPRGAPTRLIVRDVSRDGERPVILDVPVRATQYQLTDAEQAATRDVRTWQWYIEIRIGPEPERFGPYQASR